MRYIESEIMRGGGIVYEGVGTSVSWALKDGTVERFLADQKVLRSAVLDLGCGNGVGLSVLQKLGAERLCGVDLECYLGEEMRGRTEFQSVDLNFERLPWPDGTFDLVMGLQMVEHLENPFFVVREAARVLKDGGWLLLSIPNPLNLVFRFKYLLTGNMPPWTEGNNHLLFLTDAVFKKTYLRYFRLGQTTYQSGDLPFFGRLRPLFRFAEPPKHAQILPRSRTFGRRVFYALQKLPTEAKNQ